MEMGHAVSFFGLQMAVRSSNWSLFHLSFLSHRYHG
jgi:hypothetical protein